MNLNASRSRRRCATFVSTFALVMSLVSCQLAPTFTTGYEIASVPRDRAALRGSLAVLRFREERPPRFYNTQGRMFMTYIPLLPYVTLRWERLDESMRIQSDAIEKKGRGMTLGSPQPVAPRFDEYHYPESFPRAIAKDLEAAGLFSSVAYVGEESAEGHEYRLSGTLRETPLRYSVTSFGLGIFGVLLWLLPIPMAKTTGGLVLDLELVDQSTGAVIWRRTISSEIDRYLTLYTSSAMIYGRGGAFSFNLVPPPSDSKVDRHSLFSWHFEALRRGMLEAKDDLARSLESP